MAARDCNKCGEKHVYPWGRSCRLPASRYSEFSDNHQDSDYSDSEIPKSRSGHFDHEMSQWVTEAVAQSKAASYDIIRGVEHRLLLSMEERFSTLETLIKKNTASDNSPRNTSTSPAFNVALGHGSGSTRQSSQPAPQASQPAANQQSTPGMDTTPSHQLSDALRQLSLAIEPNVTERTEGMHFRPEWHSQHLLKDISAKNTDYQKMSINELLYGMICVFENMVTTGNNDWLSYMQHMKFVARQSISNVYTDQAFSGYDRMVVNKYLENPRLGFQAGDVVSVSSNFHAANLKSNTKDKFVNKKGRKGQRPRGETDEIIEIPDGWPEDICFYYNRRRCFGRCNRSHVCKRCRGTHKDIDCKSNEKKN